MPTLSINVRDGQDGTLAEVFSKTRELCGELFEKSGWEILPGETKTKGDLLDVDFTYEIRPAGELVITSAPGYRGDPYFVWVKIKGWDSTGDGAALIDGFLAQLDSAVRFAFGDRVNVSLLR